MLTTAIETIHEGLEELKPILPVHYAELSAHCKYDIPLNPMYDRYLAKEAQGEILYVTLREAGTLVGYFVGMIGPGLHYKDCLTLHMDIFYVVPEARGRDGGGLIIDAIDREFARRKVKLWTMGYKEEHRPWMEKLLFKKGFAPFERTVARWSD